MIKNIIKLLVGRKHNSKPLPASCSIFTGKEGFNNDPREYKMEDINHDHEHRDDVMESMEHVHAHEDDPSIFQYDKRDDDDDDVSNSPYIETGDFENVPDNKK
jgi:hypothetical protein